MAADFDQQWDRERAGRADQQVGLRLNSGPLVPFAPAGSKEAVADDDRRDLVRTDTGAGV
ncbi:hypothetical protein [Streptomyces sp. 147326]|uniref:hypothetical protein n=1 Tax=Streptomyces sp. 147326 TaxID=3074379 RepID=UPI003857A6D9